MATFHLRYPIRGRGARGAVHDIVVVELAAFASREHFVDVYEDEILTKGAAMPFGAVMYRVVVEIPRA